MRFLVGIAAAICLAAAPAFADDAKPLTTYSVVEVASLFIEGQIIKIYRDGDRAMMEQSAPKQSNGATPPRTRTYYDLKAGRSYTLDLDNPLVTCGVSNLSGDWGDPFSASAQMSAEMAKTKPIAAGMDTVNGIKTKVLIASTPQGRAKLWIDPQSGLVMKWEATEAKGQPQLVMEVKEFSTAAPPAKILDVPASCTKISDDTQSLHLVRGPGGGENGVTSAIRPPPSANSCATLLRVVSLGSMKPIPGGYQLGIDRDVDPNHPASYGVGWDANDHANFSGGKLRDETKAIKGDTLRIENMPRQIHVELCFGKGGCNSALIYRHCTAPESILLFAVHNPARPPDGGDWVWINAKKP